MTKESPQNHRVLIVEDESILSMMLEDIVEELGFKVVGPVARVEHALAKLDSEQVDCALLDVNLNGVASYRVADELSARNLPFLFLTGYGREGLQPAYRKYDVLGKPVTQDALERALYRMLA